MTKQAFLEAFLLLALSTRWCSADKLHGLLRNNHARNSNMPVGQRAPSSGGMGDHQEDLEASDLAETHDQAFWESRLLMFHSMATTPPTNNECSAAIEVNPDDDTRVVGNTLDVRYDEASLLCDHGTSSSPALWYVVQGTGETMRADTCSNYTDFNTVISILEGPCGVANSTCLVSNDDSCGPASSSVIWPTEAGVDYYIRVAGSYDGQVGAFGLRVSTFEAAPNDACSGAIELTVGVTVSASMEGASPGESIDCFYDTTSPGIWYYVDGLGSALAISTSDAAGNGAFSGYIQVFEGSSCSSGLVCSVISDDSDCSSSACVKFLAEEDKRYYILFVDPWDRNGFDENKKFNITVSDFNQTK